MRSIRIVVTAALLTFFVTACGSSSKNMTASPSPSSLVSTTPTYTAGDRAACTAYRRLWPQTNKNLLGLQGEATFVVVYEEVLDKAAHDVEGQMVAARSNDLVAARDATVAALRSGSATAAAWTEGELNLSDDFTAVYESSGDLARICGLVDPASEFKRLFQS